MQTNNKTSLVTEQVIPRQRVLLALRPNERGFASLVVGLILIVVLALLTVGFAQLSRHEQQQALGNQLATQAYYAAESGINDAISDITTVDSVTGQPFINGSDSSSTTCMTPASTGLPTTAKTANPYIDQPDQVYYSCLLVNLNTPDLQYTNVGVENSRTVVSSTNNPLNTLVISWASYNNQTTNFASPFPNFSPTANWRYPGVLQFSITPLNTVTRAALTGNMFTVYAYPTNGHGSSSVAYAKTSANAAAQGQTVSGNCVAPTTAYNACKITITGLGAAGGGPYLLHFLNFYNASNVQISGTDASNAAVTFSGGQAQIDVTGKAKDVLKRLQVRVPLGGTEYPDFALQAQDICKRLQSNSAGTDFIDPSGAQTTADPCGLENIH